MNGKCPICSNELQQEEKYLTCGKHYRIKKATYNRAWKKFDEGEMTKTNVNALMKTLIEKNEAEEQVKVNYELEED